MTAPTKPGYAGHGEAHTPGPWRIDPCWDVLGNTDDGNGMVCQIIVDAVPRDEAEANARLIAAAPDMYEALTGAPDMAAFWEVDGFGVARSFDRTGYVIAYSKWTKVRDAAIAKAEGRADA